MRVLVIGGGIGGIATALALERAGLDPLIFEQATESTEIGAGIGMHANAMRVLNHLGAGDFVHAHGVRVERGEWRRLDDGRTVFTQEYAGMAAHYGEHYICMHRADLLESLVRLVPPERIRRGAKLVEFEQRPDGVIARFENGDEAHGDLLVGADGLRSTVRGRLFGDQPARFTGFAAWRGIIPVAAMPAGFERTIVTWPGPGRHGMTYPIRRTMHTFNGFVPTSEILRETWGPSDDLDDLRRSFEGANEDVLEIIDAITEALITPIYFRDPLPVWGGERVVLLGDAAHPTPPSAGQGAAMAVEDAVTLAACLRRAGGPSGVPAALAEYAARRQPRTAGMLIAARNNFEMFNEPDPVQMRARDGRLRGLLRTDPVGETTFGWLYGYDALAAAQAPLAPAAAAPPARRRPAARDAYRRWSEAVTLEDRARLWLGERAGYERFLATVCPAPAHVRAAEVEAGGVPALRVAASERADGTTVVLHLHGGGYSMGSARGAVALAARLAAAVGGWALVPDYRLAPEHPFPAALDDALAAHRWLARAHPQARVVVSGECAGGGLAIALAVRLRDAGEPLPAALHVVSPFCDLTLSSASANALPSPDPWLHRDRLRFLAASYIHEQDPAAPLISPLFADLRGLPPLLVQAAADEGLRDDATRLATAAQDAGVDVSLELVPDSVHSFVLFEQLPETEVALRQFAQHVCRDAAANAAYAAAAD
jgi:salicylate hydroxylase